MTTLTDSLIRDGAETYVRFLVAAEEAVLRGQFNVAKVLRALAASQRAQAMAAAHVNADSVAVETLLAQFATRLQGISATGGTATTPTVFARGAAIALDTLHSLQAHPDVPEWVVHQRLYTCLRCGNVVQDAKPERCDVCGVLGTEFELFGPFYGASSEHLGQLMPDAIIDILRQTPEHVVSLLAAVNEQQLAAKPSPEEWSIKELVGHLVETDINFLERMEALRSGTIYHQGAPPWKLHEGKGYEVKDKDTLLVDFRATRTKVLEYVATLTEQEWAKSGTLLGERRSLVDTGTWLANHDRGHLAQIARQVGQNVE